MVVVAFLRGLSDLDQRAAEALAAAREDRIAWVAYPKGGKLGTDLNRDLLADAMRARGVDPVRQVAIEATWSALRFRPTRTSAQALPARHLHRRPVVGHDAAMPFGPGVPILRIFDVDTAKDFCIGYIGMTLDFEHRFEPAFPLFTQVSRQQIVLHLSEHHGDGTPTVVYVPIEGVRGLHAGAKEYGYLRPGVTTGEMGACLQLLDPFGNTPRFEEPALEG